jgi:glycerophosphoryl diester phosphodiesterase
VFRYPADRTRPFVWAHRGAMALAPENTISSFLLAERLGADGVELDVHRTRDGIAAVVHDAWVSPVAFRVARGDGLSAEVQVPTAALTAGAVGVDIAADAHALRLGVRMPRPMPLLMVGETDWADLRVVPRGLDANGRPVYVPRLEEVFEALAPTTAVDVEIKSAPEPFTDLEYPGLVDDVIAILRRYHREESAIVASFDHRLLRRFAAKAPDIATFAILHARVVDPAAVAAAIPTTHLDLDVSFTAEADVAACHGFGLSVAVGGLDSPLDVGRVHTWGVEAVTLDDPRWASSPVDGADGVARPV